MDKLTRMRLNSTVQVLILTLSLLLATGMVGGLPCARAELARDPGPIERPRKLPSGKLIGDTLYCIVVPGHPLHGEEPPVDWEYGLWKYSLKNECAELLIPFKQHTWLDRAGLPMPLPGGLLLMRHIQDQNVDFREDLKRCYIVTSSTGELVSTVALTAYHFEEYHCWGYLQVHGELATLEHPTFFKVLTLRALLNEEDSDYIVGIPLYGSSDPLKGQRHYYSPFPLKLADDGASPFLVLDNFFGFRILDRDGRLLYQGGQVLATQFSNRFWGMTRDSDALDNIIRACYPEKLDQVLYTCPIYSQLTDENLILFYDQELRCIFVCSPLGDFYKKIDRPSDTWKKRIVGAGLTGEDGYMLLFEDGSTFVADYSDIAKQVRAGKLDPLKSLRELMGLEKE